MAADGGGTAGVQLRNWAQSGFGAGCLMLIALAFGGIALQGAVVLGLAGVTAFILMSLRALRTGIRISAHSIEDRGVLRTRRFDRQHVSAIRVARAHALPWFGIEICIDSAPPKTVALNGAWFWGERGRRTLETAVADVR